ncbi:MAG: tellurium resistance protein TerC [Rhizobiaceae bacterium]|nr:tellurium resistance protein TerC [Rhizobiaceae bacterium]
MMADLFTLDNLFTLMMLLLLQMVLGFDNLLYISIESKRAPTDKQKLVRRWGILIAIGLRIILLFVIVNAIEFFQGELFSLNIRGLFSGSFNGHSLIVIFGGGFIIYTALKEITHLLSVQDLGQEGGGSSRSMFSVITWIVVMNLVFSFDSILSALALTDVFMVMAVAIILSGIMMLVLADHVSVFLEKNRMYEVLGLFVLFIVGIMLVSEGGHLAHITLAGHPVEQMSKSTFYFVLIILFVVEVVQSRYQKKLLANGSGKKG